MECGKISTTDMASFLSALRSDRLVKFLESNQKHFQDVINTMDSKIKQCEKEIMEKDRILQRNSIINNELQNQIRDLFEQNSTYSEQQQELLNENLNLQTKLISSEERFAELDIAYDEQVFKLTEKVKELEEENVKLKIAADEVAKAETIEQLKTQHEKEKMDFQMKIGKTNEITESLKKALSESNGLVEDLRTKIVDDSDKEHHLLELKKIIEQLNNERLAEQREFRNEKSQMIVAAGNLKLELDNCKEKLVAQERKIVQAYMKYKQLSRIAAPISDPKPIIQPSEKMSKRRQSSGDASSDSDSSSISFCNLRKRRKLEDRPQFGNNAKSRQSANVAPLVFAREQQTSEQHPDLEIPETSSSPRSNQD